MGYKKILVTLDGSKLAEGAIKHVFRVAAPDAIIHLLSVMPQENLAELGMLTGMIGQPISIPRESWAALPKSPDPASIDARWHYLDYVGHWLEEADYRVTSEVRTGEPSEIILEVAQHGYDVILMVTHARTGIDRAILGSVTHTVLNKATCPVLVIPPHEVEPSVGESPAS